DFEASVEKTHERKDRKTNAAIGRWTGVVRRNGPRKSSPRARARSRQRSAVARHSAKRMFATATPGTQPTPRRKKTNVARSRPLRRAIGSGRNLRDGSGLPGVRGKRLLDEHDGDVRDDRVDATARRAREALRDDGLLVLQRLAVLLDDGARDAPLERAQ